MILAHSDSYPMFIIKLSGQFWPQCEASIYKKLDTKYDLKTDYFQSTTLLFDTAILKGDTQREIVELYHEWGEVCL